MTATSHDTDELLERAETGDDRARHQLLDRHRARLRRMIALRLDRRITARVDPSDVVQETLVVAGRKLDDYLRDRPLPFYPWLRQIAWDRLVELRRRHVGAQARSVLREERCSGLPDESVAALAERLASSGTSPSHHLLREENRQRVRAALEALEERDSEILILRHLEGMSIPEAAAVLGITERAAKARHMRALVRLRELLGNEIRG